MGIKPITAIAVLVIVIASLFVPGCTTESVKSNGTPPNGTLIEVISKEDHAQGKTGDKYTYYNGVVLDFVEKYHNQLNATQTPTYKITDWRQSRIDLTTMSVYWAFSNTTVNKNETEFVTATAKLFPTNDDALSFVNAHNMGMKQSSERHFFTIDSSNSYETKSRFVMYTENFVIYGDKKITEY